MLLAVDVGNTNIKLGIFEGDKLRATLHLATHVDHMPDEYAVVILNLLRHQGIEISDIKAGAISCVVPPLSPAPISAKPTAWFQRIGSPR